ncbi:MAG: DUF5063 domain-containing protein [Bacteroidales bacterium]|nr:MAG: DUF5063 domain-containing protein [Bacteroidales bacterium]
MSDNGNHIVFSKNVIEFVTVAKEYCTFLDNIDRIKRTAFIDKSRKILSLLYLKAALLPANNPVLDEGNEKFVTEAEWDLVHTKVLRKLGQYDQYTEVFDPRMQEDGEPFQASLSENLADIYQNLMDFLLLYRIGNTDIMNDALWECRLNFEQYWGQGLVNALGALNRVLYGGDIADENGR